MKKDIEMCTYKEMLDIESKVCHTVIDKQKGLLDKANSYIA